MKQIVSLKAEAAVEVPPDLRASEVAEGLLQEFSAFLTARPGLRASHVEVSADREVRGYVLQDAPVEFPARPSRVVSLK